MVDRIGTPSQRAYREPVSSRRASARSRRAPRRQCHQKCSRDGLSRGPCCTVAFSRYCDPRKRLSVVLFDPTTSRLPSTGNGHVHFKLCFDSDVDRVLDQATGMDRSARTSPDSTVTSLAFWTGSRAHPFAHGRSSVCSPSLSRDHWYDSASPVARVRDVVGRRVYCASRQQRCGGIP